MDEPGRELLDGASNVRSLVGSLIQQGGGRSVREDEGDRLDEEDGGMSATSWEDGRNENVEVRALTSRCGVCTAPATHHRHYGAVSCNSCRWQNGASPYFSFNSNRNHVNVFILLLFTEFSSCGATPSSCTASLATINVRSVQIIEPIVNHVVTTAVLKMV